MTAHSNSTHPHPFESLRGSKQTKSRMWLVMPILGLGLLAAALIVLWYEPLPQQTVSEVHRNFRAIALAKSAKPGLDDGGPVGPWWITASDVDPVTGVFQNFHVRSGGILIAADRARLEVDPQTDTFSFQLDDVVFTQIPDRSPAGAPGSSKLLDAPGESFVSELEHHTLGPAPYGMDIVPDRDVAPESVADIDLPIERSE